MANYLLVYHGGSKPEDPADIAQVMQAWGDWFTRLGSAVIDAGNPVGLSTTVHSDGSVSHDGGSNPASGYSLIAADSVEDAVAKAKGCPILESGGSVELAEILQM